MPIIKAKRDKQLKKVAPRKKLKKADESTPLKQPFLKRLFSGEEKLDLSELESGPPRSSIFSPQRPLIPKAGITSLWTAPSPRGFISRTP